MLPLGSSSTTLATAVKVVPLVSPAGATDMVTIDVASPRRQTTQTPAAPAEGKEEAKPSTPMEAKNVGITMSMPDFVTHLGTLNKLQLRALMINPVITEERRDLVIRAWEARLQTETRDEIERRVGLAHEIGRLTGEIGSYVQDQKSKGGIVGGSVGVTLGLIYAGAAAKGTTATCTTLAVTGAPGATGAAGAAIAGAATPVIAGTATTGATLGTVAAVVGSTGAAAGTATGGAVAGAVLTGAAGPAIAAPAVASAATVTSATGTVGAAAGTAAAKGIGAKVFSAVAPPIAAGVVLGVVGFYAGGWKAKRDMRLRQERLNELLAQQRLAQQNNPTATSSTSSGVR
jgi:hypothetical protein